MTRDYDDWQPKVDRVYLQQQAVQRYRILQDLKESELIFDDKLFMENFQAALHFWSS
jgi:hypothetical protein